jgi:hypothetical protein
MAWRVAGRRARTGPCSPARAAWLELDYDDRVLRLMHCPERWQFAHSGPAGELFGGDPKFFRDPRLRPISAPVPAESDPVRELPEPMRRKITELAGYLGY